MQTAQKRALNPFHTIIRYSNFRLLWGSGIIMQMSEWVQTITLGWLALNLTNSAAFVGQVNALLGLPLLLLSLPAGMVLDRVDRRRVLIGCQIAGVVIALGVAFMISSSTLDPWHLLVIAVLNGSLLALSVPTFQALVPGMVERDDLTNALGLSAAGSSSTRILGPSIGGIIIGAVGSVGAYLFQAAALVVAAALSFFVRIDNRQQRQNESVSNEQRAGLSTIVRDPLVVGLLLQAMAPSLFAYPVLALLPVLARDHLHLDATGLGLLMAASGTGAIIGSVVVSMIGSYRHKGRLLATVGVVYGLVMVAFAQSPWPVLSGVLFACSSFLGISHNALTTALLQTLAPEEARGQITGALTLSFGLSPIGALALGSLAEYIGVSNAISCGAIASSICVASIALVYRKLLQL